MSEYTLPDATVPFRSAAEMEQMFDNPRYQTDSAYRAVAAARLALGANHNDPTSPPAAQPGRVSTRIQFGGETAEITSRAPIRHVAADGDFERDAERARLEGELDRLKKEHAAWIAAEPAAVMAAYQDRAAMFVGSPSYKKLEGVPFASVDEMTNAMSSALYRDDRAIRAHIERRVAAGRR